jgi:hypothetical protein
MTQSQVRIGWRAYVDYGLDASATAFSNAAGLVDTTQRTAINTLVKDLKRFGLWSKIKAFYPFVGGSATSHKYNLVDPRDTNDAYRLTFSGGWTHDSNGAQCNGTNTTANTNLSLRTVLGTTSYEHNLGFYINYYNPSWSYRDDMGAYDGNGDFNTNPRIGLTYDTNNVYVMNLRGNRQYFDFMFSKSVAPSGLTEMKRYAIKYMCMFRNGYEIESYRSTSYDATFYNPVSNVYIGSGASWSRYAAAYITDALSSIESYLMYVAVQRYQTTLARQIGTAIPVSPSLLSYGSTAAPSLVTSNLKVSLDTSTLSQPLEGGRGTNGNWYHGIVPGSYFLSGATWSDVSGSGNHAAFWSTNAGGDIRSAQYFVDKDINITEVRFRNQDNTAGKGKLYQNGSSIDAVITPYKGSDTGTFTVSTWVKLNSLHNYFYVVRGNDYNTVGGGWSILLGGSVGGKISVSAVPTGGAVTGTSNINQGLVLSTSTMNSDTWYYITMVWKPYSYIKVYVNGTLEGNASMTCPGVRSSSWGWLMSGGKLDAYGTRGIHGALHIYDRELSATEVLQNFEAGRRRYNI